MSNEANHKETKDLLKQVIAPRKDTELRRDLWPQMLLKLDHHSSRVPWFDWTLAAILSAVAARLITRRVPRLSTLSPLMRLSRHSPSQEAKCDSVFHRFMSKPLRRSDSEQSLHQRHQSGLDPLQISASVRY